MKKKINITLAVATLAILSLVITVHQFKTQAPTKKSTVRPVSALSGGNRDNISPTLNKAVVADEGPIISTQNPLQDTALTEIDFEPANQADTSAILMESTAPRDNPTPTPEPSQSKAVARVQEPKMGDTRIVGVQKQVYFLGFGWIEDNAEPNECIYAEDMYENGNKVGIMGESDGDINIIVGIMD